MHPSQAVTKSQDVAAGIGSALWQVQGTPHVLHLLSLPGEEQQVC